MDPRPQRAISTQLPPATAPDPRAGGRRSARLVLAPYWLALAIGTHWPSFSADLQPPPGNSHPIHALQVDKGLHFVAFGLLGFLLIRARPWVRRLGQARSAAVAVLIALVYAPIDEFTQALAIERTPSLGDLTANTLGILCVYLLLRDDTAPGPRPGRGLTGPAAVGVVLGGVVLSWSRGALGLALTGWALAWSQWALLFGIGLAITLLLAGYRRTADRPNRVVLALAIGWVALSAPMVEVSRGLAGLPIDPQLLMAQEVGLVAALLILAGRQSFAAWRGQAPLGPLCPSTGGAAA